MTVLLYGANPALTLFADDHAEVPVAFACVWRVDWSIHGPGTALLVWHAGRIRVITEAPLLGGWLTDAFTRHFPEVRALPWGDPELVQASVLIDMDPAAGLSARAADVDIDIAQPMDRRVIAVESFPGNGYRLSNVYTPCRRGVLSIAGVQISGEPITTETPRASSTAFLADAEVWSAPPT